MTTAARSKLLTMPELAERLRISKRSAYRVAREMMHVEIAGRMQVSDSEVERYIAARTRGPLDERHPLAQLLHDEARAAVAGLSTCCTAMDVTYFVSAGALIKVGRSRTSLFPNRMAQLQCQSPAPLSILAVSRGGDMEGRVHLELAAHRAHGEWFDSSVVLAFIGRLGGRCLSCGASP